MNNSNRMTIFVLILCIISRLSKLYSVLRCLCGPRRVRMEGRRRKERGRETSWQLFVSISLKRLFLGSQHFIPDTDFYNWRYLNKMEKIAKKRWRIASFTRHNSYFYGLNNTKCTTSSNICISVEHFTFLPPIKIFIGFFIIGISISSVYALSVRQFVKPLQYILIFVWPIEWNAYYSCGCVQNNYIFKFEANKIKIKRNAVKYAHNI